MLAAWLDLRLEQKKSVTAMLDSISFISKLVLFFSSFFQLSVIRSQNSLLGIVHCG